MTHNLKSDFQTASEMPYANNDQIKNKAEILFKGLSEHLKTIQKDKSLFFKNGETVYIPDIHGDFVHLMITLHRHGLLESEVAQPHSLNLKKDFQYVFLGDFYDRAPDSDVIDYWLNNQIRNKLKIYRLIGNHEMAFFERDPNGYPMIFPSQDSIKDISNDFQITENLLRNIASGNIIAAYVTARSISDPLRLVGDKASEAVPIEIASALPRNDINQHYILYVHSYVINEDFTELELDINSDIYSFAQALNERLKTHGQYAYDLFLEHKKDGKYDWKAIMKSFNDDPLFNMYKKKNDISTSFIWRRTGLSRLNIFPCELDIEIPNDVYQIVGHTPVFSFDLPKSQEINRPFIVCAKSGGGKIQFSDVGIGYHYKNDFERPEVTLIKF
ncbi:MAG: metallophosphoesterase [Candidatus Melainabacteria bacterium]|nr:metallophosphoesterase [Candidatus Melainabacteria bacterium]